MIQVLSYKPEALEILSKIYQPWVSEDVYVAKSLQKIHEELCNVLPSKNFDQSDLYEVLKEAGYTPYPADDGGYEFRLVSINKDNK